MDTTDAAALIAPAVRAPGEHWADLGAGHGTFTAALATLLGPHGHIEAVDVDPGAVAALGRLARRSATPVAARRGDFAAPAFELPRVDGILLANALHFVDSRAQADVLARLATRLNAGGRVLVVEYDARPASRWVPYPMPLARLRVIAPDGMTVSAIGTRRSAYGGAMYAAVLEGCYRP